MKQTAQTLWRLWRLTAVLLSVVCCSLLLSACQSVANTTGNLKTKTTTHAIELQDVPFYPDSTTLCGPSALAAVLQFSGVDVSVDELTRDVYLPGRSGSLQIEMLNTARHKGRVAYILEPNTEAIQVALSNRFPVLVLLNLGLSFAPSWHYAVVVGFRENEKGQRDFLLRSGTEMRQTMTEELFNRVWSRGNHWALILSEASKVPEFLPPGSMLRAILAMPQTKSTPDRQIALQKAHIRFPSDDLISFALAAEYQKNGELVRAEQLWRTLSTSQNNPAAAANLAALLNGQGRMVEAAHWACVARANLDTQKMADATKRRILLETDRILTSSKTTCGFDQ